MCGLFTLEKASGVGFDSCQRCAAVDSAISSSIFLVAFIRLAAGGAMWFSTGAKQVVLFSAA